MIVRSMSIHLDHMYPSIGVASYLKYIYTPFNSQKIVIEHMLTY